jgi:hypothetical protein
MSGDVAFPGLGRAREPDLVGVRRFRVTVQATGYRTVYPPPGSALVVDVASWSPNRPPTTSAVPFVLPLLPATDYPFPPGTPLMNGRVENQAAEAVQDAEVSATVVVGTETLRERVHSDERGGFRLPLRWAAGATQVDATKDTLTGSVTITVPTDLSTTHVITVS